MAEPILAVDLGTDTSAAAIVAQRRTALLRDPLTATDMWPSALCVSATGLLAGTAAERRRRAEPGRYVAGPRRAVDAQAPIRLGDRELSGSQVLTAYLSTMAAEARDVYGSALPRLVLTVPAGYGVPDARRDTMIAIGEAAGFAEVELIADAVAVALDPQTGADLADGSLAVTCDLGATWTAALVRVDRDRPRLLAERTGSGGHDLDTALLVDLRSRARTWLEPMLAAPGDPGRRAHLEALDLVRRLKHRLSTVEHAADHLTALTPAHGLDRGALAAVAAGAVQALVAGCRQMLAEYGATPADVAAVVLAGGGARMPLAAAAVRDALGQVPRCAAEPESAAVRGAARWADRADERRVPAIAPRWRQEPTTWAVPEGSARLLRWTAPPGAVVPAGAVVAELRTTDDLVHELIAPRSLALHAPLPEPGERVGPLLSIAASRGVESLAVDPPALQRRWESAESWLLTPDRRTLIAVGRAGVRVLPLDGPERAFAPEAPVCDGRVFLGPGDRPFLVGWDDEGVSVWDVASGKPAVRLPEAAGANAVLVDETAWRLATEAPGRGPGRYRRPVVTLWDLRTGARLDRLTDVAWRRHHPGYAERSTRDGFAASARSGPLHAAASAEGVRLLLDGVPVFDEPVQGAAVAFCHAGTRLLVRAEHEGRSRVDVRGI
jgi:molecular chaperone DnaK